MKLFILAHAYPGFLNQIYSARPVLATLDYRAQFEALDREAHIWGNSTWPVVLGPLGYDVEVAIGNNERMQKTWTRERGIPCHPASWQTDVAEAQIAAFRPDLLFLTTHSGLHPGWIQHLRESNSKLRLVGIWCGMPFDSAEVFAPFDLVVTCAPELQGRFSSLGCHCRQMHHAFDPRVLHRIDADRDQDILFSFIGQLIRDPGFHQQRIRQLEDLVDALEITIFSPEPEPSHPPRWSPLVRARGFLGRLLRGRYSPRELLDRFLFWNTPHRFEAPPSGISEKLRAHTRPGVYGLAMYKILQRSQVAYNSHGEVASRFASNRRLFESTGVASCLLTDYKDNISTLFEPDREVVTFSSTAECIEKAKWLLAHPHERRTIARAGQRRTLAEHTYTQRATQLDAILREALHGARAAKANLPSS